MCWSAINLGITWIGYIFKKSNKMRKEGNVGIKIKYISLLKKKLFEQKIFFYFNLIKRIQKTCKFFLIWNINLAICHKKSFYFEKNVGFILSKISMLEKKY